METVVNEEVDFLTPACFFYIFKLNSSNVTSETRFRSVKKVINFVDWFILFHLMVFILVHFIACFKFTSCV